MIYRYHWQCGWLLHNIAYSAAIAKVEHKYLGHIKDTPYLALTGELCGVYCEYVGEQVNSLRPLGDLNKNLDM